MCFLLYFVNHCKQFYPLLYFVTGQLGVSRRSLCSFFCSLSFSYAVQLKCPSPGLISPGSSGHPTSQQLFYICYVHYKITIICFRPSSKMGVVEDLGVPFSGPFFCLTWHSWGKYSKQLRSPKTSPECGFVTLDPAGIRLVRLHSRRPKAYMCNENRCKINYTHKKYITTKINKIPLFCNIAMNNLQCGIFVQQYKEHLMKILLMSSHY